MSPTINLILTIYQLVIIIINTPVHSDLPAINHKVSEDMKKQVSGFTKV